MALCSYSSKLALDNYTVLDNRFLNEFLPSATGDDVKVYLFGLTLCSNPEADDNSLETIAKILAMPESQVKKAFEYWQEMGLVQIVSRDPFEVRYLPVKSNSGSNKIRNTGKYADFNKQMQEIISGRMITPVEFNEYYSLIESYHFEPEAVLLIAKYCTHNKTNAISYSYILAVARDFASENLKTFQAVEEKFMEQEKASDSIGQILTTLGLKRKADIDERNMFLKWTKTFGFNLSVILAVAKSLKRRGGFAALDKLLTKYFEMKLMSVQEIESYSSVQDEMYECAKVVCKNLGIIYQDYENVVSTYIAEWFGKGYDTPTLEYASNYCFKQSVRTLEGMSVIIQKFYKLGLISIQAIEEYIGQILAHDNNIREILEITGLVRSVSSYDRENYKTWTENWNYSHEEIKLVAEQAKGKANPMAYLNKIMASLSSSNIHGEKKIKEHLEKTPVTYESALATKKPDFETRDYTPEELNSVFDSLKDVEL